MPRGDAKVFCSFKARLSHYKQDSFESHAHLGSAKATALIHTGRGSKLQTEGLFNLTPSTIFFFKTMPANLNPENTINWSEAEDIIKCEAWNEHTCRVCLTENTRCIVNIINFTLATFYHVILIEHTSCFISLFLLLQLLTAPFKLSVLFVQTSTRTSRSSRGWSARWWSCIWPKWCSGHFEAIVQAHKDTTNDDYHIQWKSVFTRGGGLF